MLLGGSYLGHLSLLDHAPSVTTNPIYPRANCYWSSDHVTVSTTLDVPPPAASGSRGDRDAVVATLQRLHAAAAAGDTTALAALWVADELAPETAFLVSGAPLVATLQAGGADQTPGDAELPLSVAGITAAEAFVLGDSAWAFTREARGDQTVALPALYHLIKVGGAWRITA